MNCDNWLAPKNSFTHRIDRFALTKSWGIMVLEILQAHALADGPLHAHQTNTILVFKKFTHRAHSAIAKVIDVIHFALTVFQLDQSFHSHQDVFFGERPMIDRALFKGNVEAVLIFNRPTSLKS